MLSDSLCYLIQLGEHTRALVLNDQIDLVHLLEGQNSIESFFIYSYIVLHINRFP